MTPPRKLVTHELAVEYQEQGGPLYLAIGLQDPGQLDLAVLQAASPGAAIFIAQQGYPGQILMVWGLMELLSEAEKRLVDKASATH